MKRLLVLGAGTAGTMVVNKLRERLDDDWAITIVDAKPEHHYQPGYLFIPFGIYEPGEVVKPTAPLITDGVDVVFGEVDLVEPDANVVVLGDGTRLSYDQLVIATGTHPRRGETDGFDSDEYGTTIHDFYTLEGARQLGDTLADWEGGRLVVNVVEMPIKCPVAPLEFLFLADAFFTDRGMRDQVELVYATPLDGAFTKPVAAKHLGTLLDDRNIVLETDFMTMEADTERNVLVSYDEREVPYDLLVAVPVNMGADFVERSGLGDELNHVEVDKHTFLSVDHDNIFALGDASNIPTSKAGSVAHFAVEVFVDNFLQHIKGRPMTGEFDGHANCFIETGHGKGLLIDFNYDVEPLPGKYPLPGIGPFSLLKETEANHWGKLMFKWTYWNMLLPGRDLPLESQMTMAGKRMPVEVSS
ncbi:MAG: FAD/NAD(P)-binding oxidoreductase [Ilumatobacter sp.]|uniref:type III sulfide quinone reductase, selenoprotein subtype n=1 Tax=Ilumatobacter sp. TaxID=1967498 RepID=UPI002622521E|nr:FAD/NAD(P)-binding oxidoreductase [Ilumatobacter sp.]MDJ0769984.1 FAD/NAD(P)-binding oxidoreductase [Ilumatobacter sp.]